MEVGLVCGELNRKSKTSVRVPAPWVLVGALAPLIPVVSSLAFLRKHEVPWQIDTDITEIQRSY